MKLETIKETMPPVENPKEPSFHLKNVKTLAEGAYESLRTDIRSGKLEPGIPLRTNKIRSLYGISVSPLREAFFRLAAENLVVSEGQRGFRVAQITLSDFSDILQLRENLEYHSLKNALELGDDNWEANIVSCMHKLSIVPPVWKSNDLNRNEERHRRHRDFHFSLLAACDSVWRLRFWKQLEEQVERYRRIVLYKKLLSKSLEKKIDKEHHFIMEAVLDRDFDESRRLLRQHDTWSTNLVKQMLKERESKQNSE